MSTHNVVQICSLTHRCARRLARLLNTICAAEMWVKCLRSDINHRDDHTTALAEGYHSVLKSLLRSMGGEGQRVDKRCTFSSTRSRSWPFSEKCGGTMVRIEHTITTQCEAHASHAQQAQ